jgi:hypothetical protein
MIIGTAVYFPGFAFYKVVDINVPLTLGKVSHAARYPASETFHRPLCKPRNFHRTADKFHRFEVQITKRLRHIFIHDLIVGQTKS